MPGDTAPRADKLPKCVTNIKRKIMAEIYDFFDCLGHGPTEEHLRECFCGMTDIFDIHMEQLAREGLIRLAQDGSGTIALPSTFGAVPPIEICGISPPPGSNGQASTIRGSIGFDLRSLGIEAWPGMTGFRVLHDDMIDAGIHVGDIAVMADLPVRPGDIIAVEIEEHLVLRRYVVIGELEYIIAENALDPSLIYLHGTPIRGVVRHVIRTQMARSSMRRDHTKFRYDLAATPPESEYAKDWVVWPPKPKLPSNQKRTSVDRSNPLVVSVSPSKTDSKRSKRPFKYEKQEADLPPAPGRVDLNDAGIKSARLEE